MATTCTATDSVNQIVETLQVRFSSVDKDALELELRNCLREFCTRSNAWTAFRATPIKSGVSIYNISPDDANAEICTILAVAVDGRPIGGWSGDYLPPAHRINTDYIINPDKMVAKRLSTIRLDSTYTTDANKEFIITVAQRPRRGFLFIPDMLGFDHFDTIIAGTAARMMEHTNRPYTDSDAAYRARRQFMSGLTRAREKTLARFGKLAAPWTYPQQAPGRRYR